LYDTIEAKTTRQKRGSYMRLKFDIETKHQADPYVFKDGDTYYLYPSDAFGNDGIPVYSTKILSAGGIMRALRRNLTAQ
jgi:hypothetical protein